MHQRINLFYFGMTLYMFRTVFPSITMSSRLYIRHQEDRGSTVVKVAGSIPAAVTGFFMEINPFRSHYGPGFDSDSNRNEYQEYFLRVKAASA